MIEEERAVPDAIHRYFERPQNRREHMAMLTDRLHARSFARSDIRDLVGWLTPAAQTTRRADILAGMVLEELRRRRILLPARAAVELIIHVAIRKGQRIAHQALVHGLTSQQMQALDSLLNMREGTKLTILAWLRAPALAPSSTKFAALAERIHLLRAVALPEQLAERIPAKILADLADEGMRMSAQHIRDLVPGRRLAVLAATALRLLNGLTDNAIDMFKKMLGVLTRRADNTEAQRVTHSVRSLQKPLRAISSACHALIGARETGKDAAQAVDTAVGWDRFLESVTAIDVLIAPNVADGKQDLIARYATIRKIAPILLSKFMFRGHAVAAPLLRALALIADLYQTGRRNLPNQVPSAFVPRAWLPIIFQNGGIDRKAFEICAFCELKRRLDSRDVWIEGSKRFQSFENFLIPVPTFEIMRREGPLPVAVPADIDSFLSNQKTILAQEYDKLARLAAAGELDAVALSSEGFVVTPHKANSPDAAQLLKAQAEACLPNVKITDLLLEVDAHTGFANAFTHLRSGRTADNRFALLSTILADGTNLGLTRMADVSP